MSGEAPAGQSGSVESGVEKAPTVEPSAIGGVPAGADPADVASPSGAVAAGDAPASADPRSPTSQPGPAAEPASPAFTAGGGGAPIAGVDPAPADQSLTDRPEVLVGAAFAGGLLLAIIFRRIAS